MSFIRKSRFDAPIFLFGSFLSLSITISSSALYQINNYLFLVPIIIIGALFLYEVIYTVNYKFDFFSAVSIFGFFGLIFFYFVPLFQINWDYWPSLPNSKDMDYWSSIWVICSIIGFFLTAVGYKLTFRNTTTLSKLYIDKNKMVLCFSIGLIICLFAQGIVLAKFGGLAGYLQAYEMRIQESIQGYNPYEGLGFLFTFSESFPNLLSIFIVLLIKDKPWAKSLRVFLLLCTILLVINLIFGGLRGSRSTTIWSMFWFLVMYHTVITKVSLKLLISIGAAFFLFMSSYTLFKFGGVEGLQGIWDDDVKQQIFDRKYVGDSNKQLLVRDAGRTDVQAYILKTYWNNEHDYAFGRTLLAGAVSFVPSFIFPNKPVTAIKEKTEIFRGEFTEGNYTTLLAGGFGEFVINFGPIFGLVFFLLYGMILGTIDKFSNVNNGFSINLLLSPVLLLLTIQMLMSDSNVISQFLFRYLLIPTIVMLFCIRKKPIKRREI
jgi:hypothetical protein